MKMTYVDSYDEVLRVATIRQWRKQTKLQTLCTKIRADIETLQLLAKSGLNNCPTYHVPNSETDPTSGDFK